MKRSEINILIQQAMDFFGQHQFLLPPFAHWSPADWQARGPEAREIVDCQLGWDVTDFGSRDFFNIGLLLFTIRNGQPQNLKTMAGKIYAEKIMVVREGQITPWHFHRDKTEDIINRGGGNLVLHLANATPGEALATTEVEVVTDGVKRRIPGQGEVVLQPGESITLTPFLYHKFWAQPGKGLVLCGEVSAVNDDHCDNRFLEAPGRFPDIEEDAEPLRLLGGDYARYYKG